jgi:hypothetical protein
MMMLSEASHVRRTIEKSEERFQQQRRRNYENLEIVAIVKVVVVIRGGCKGGSM